MFSNWVSLDNARDKTKRLTIPPRRKLPVYWTEDDINRVAGGYASAVTNKYIEAGEKNPFVVNALARAACQLSMLSVVGVSKLAAKGLSTICNRPMHYQRLISARGGRDAVGDDHGLVTNSAKLLLSYGGNFTRYTRDIWSGL